MGDSLSYLDNLLVVVDTFCILLVTYFSNLFFGFATYLIYIRFWCTFLIDVPTIAFNILFNGSMNINYINNDIIYGSFFLLEIRQ